MKFAIGGIFAFLGVTFFLSPSNNYAPNQSSAKIMSINSCTDQALLALNDNGHITSLSHYSFDKYSSFVYNKAKNYNQNFGTAEEILIQKPNILLQSPFEKDAINKVASLLNIKTGIFGVPSSTAQSQEQILQIGQIINANQNAQNLVNQINLASQQNSNPKINALILYQGGYSAGQGTLVDEIMNNAGLNNMAPKYGVGNWGRVDIEKLLLNPPQIIITTHDENWGALSLRSLNHPAIRNLDIKFAHISNNLGYCGGEVIVSLANELNKIRDEYEK